ncbi:MAG TPA: recombinase family protein [Candidatus Paceibacterota bacterium]|nr:recombinase family protein [Candidatus Paceibacterota bacterium]HPT17838.1 recombinase family protein [Candidatus Paceibacterota bacterium]
MIKNTNNAVVYCRHSNEDKKSFFSAEEQFSVIRDYALQNNYQIVKRFFDIAPNQKSFTGIGISKMLDYINRNYMKIKFIIITDMTRLSRCAPEIVALKDFFKSLGIKILTLNPKEAPKHIK